LGPFKLKQIASEVDLNIRLLKVYLDFLIKQGLVEERTINIGSAVFAVTQRGINVLKYFKEYTRGISVIEKA
jgi:predicted transcriptional regulator